MLAPRLHGRTLAALALSAAIAPAQDLNELRRSLSEDLDQIDFARSLTGLVEVKDEIELGTARYSIDDGARTEVTSFALPFARAFGDPGTVRPYAEGTLGYAAVSQRVDDLFDGQNPGAATALDTDWTAWGGFVGLGVEIPLLDELTFAPIINIGLTQLQNDTSYSGPGAAAVAAVADGIAFNWDALILTSGIAARFDWVHPLTDSIELETIVRYDLRQTATIDEDDRAQRFEVTSDILTLRADLTGPTNWSIAETKLNWRATAGFRQFWRQDLLGSENFVRLGGALETDPQDSFGISVGAAAIIGDQLTGWSAGIGITF